MRYLTRVRHDLPILVGGSTILLLNPPLLWVKSQSFVGESPIFGRGPLSHYILVLDPPSVTFIRAKKTSSSCIFWAKRWVLNKEFAIKFTYLITSLAKKAMNVGIYPLVN